MLALLCASLAPLARSQIQSANTHQPRFALL
jgi:hypothetical protein